MNQTRDFNKELQDTSARKYAYHFDLDIMHPFIVRSFQPFFKEGKALELGSYNGDFTKRILPFFSDITCIDASDQAIMHAREVLDGRVNFICERFENLSLTDRFNNIFLTHVLEHSDDPVSLLHRINSEWLTTQGRLFLACPNANAPSRQIAVRMGLISHTTAITEAEAEHGHRVTYTLDTLERDAVKAGLKIVHTGGVFFKALANFQWDKLLGTDIISPAYLEGCFKFGQCHPDMCSSIFLICEPG